MSSELPQGLRQRVNAWLAQNDHGSQREAVRTLSARYAAGQTSTAIDLAPYLAARMPATFAAVAAVLAEVAKLSPEFAPTTALDVGAGPGTASFAAFAQCQSRHTFRQCLNNAVPFNRSHANPAGNLTARAAAADAELGFWIDDAHFHARCFNIGKTKIIHGIESKALSKMKYKLCAALWPASVSSSRLKRHFRI